MPAARHQAERAAAAQAEGVIDRQRALAVPRQEGEKALSAGRARALARLHRQRLAIGLERAAPGQPARIRCADAQLRPVPQQPLAGDAEAREIGGQLEPRRAGNLRLVEHAAVDRLLAFLRIDLGRHLVLDRRDVEIAFDLDVAGHGPAVDLLVLHLGGAERHHHHRTGDDLLPAPAGIDRLDRGLRLALPVPHQGIDHHQRHHQHEADQPGEQQLHPGRAFLARFLGHRVSSLAERLNGSST